MPRRARTILLLAGITLALLEALLQVVALGVWLFVPERGNLERGDAEHVVLCVGVHIVRVSLHVAR